MELVDGPPRRHPTDMEYLDPTRVLMTFEMPLAEILVDFYDQLKSRTAGLRLARLRARPATGPPTS